MPDAIITSTASTFGTISGTFAADQSTVTGTVTGIVAGTLSGSVGVPGPAGPAGAGVPAGGTAGQYLQKIDGTNYNTDWVTLNLSGYAPLASPAFTGNPTAPTAALGDNDTSLATTAFVQQELLSGTANAKNLEVYVRNQTGSTLAAGAIVYINGATGNRPTVTLAQANNDANSAQTMGFVKTAIANNGFGYVIVRGECENLDTSAVAEGTQLYLSPTTAGAWTTTKPSAPQHLVYVGIVIRSHPTQGVILVAVQNGFELDELHDVQITSPTNGQVLKYNSTTGLWYNGTDSAGVAWGGITGTLSSQLDLQSALDSKYSTTNPAGYITSSALSPYLTSATAASTYAALTGATFTGEVYTPASTTSNAGLMITPGVAPTSPQNGEIWATTTDLQVRLNNVTETVAEQSWVTAQGYLTSSALTPYLTSATAASTYAPLSGATFTGLVGTVASATTGAGLNIPHGAAPTTPVNGDIWTTTSGLFARINAGTQQFAPLGSNNTFSNASSTYGSSTATGTIGLASGATISGSTKTLNIGTGGVSGSTTLTTIGPVLGASTTSIGNTTAASTLNLATGATLTATTKAVNIGTSGVAGSTTNIAIGSTTGTSTTTLQGTTNGVTVAADTNSTALATTAYVVGQAGSATPLVNGTAAVGTSLRYARQDHVHPTDTSRAALASPAFTGTPTAPTASPGTNTTQIATTAFVTAAVPAIATFSESQQLASTTKVMSPFDVLLAMMTEGYRPALGMTGGSTGTGAGVNPIMPQYMGIGGPNAGVAGNCYAITNNFGAYSTSNSSGVTIAWNKPVCLSGTFSATASGLGDSNNEFKLFLGPSMLNGNDPTSAAIGLWRNGGTSAISLMVHNGTTLTKVASAGTYSGTNPIRYLIYSDGAGNVTLYINGTQVATTALGPTSAFSNTGQFTASILQNASAATKYYIELVHPKIFVAPQ